MKTHHLLLLLFNISLLTKLAGPAHAATHVVIRDSVTGQAIPARIEIWQLTDKLITPEWRRALKQGQPPEALLTAQYSQKTEQVATDGRLAWQAASQWRLWRVSATGHAPLQILIPPGSTAPVTTVWLDPQKENKGLAVCRTGQVCGYILSTRDFQPVAHALVSLETEPEQQHTFSDASGFFTFSIDDLPEKIRQSADTVDLTVLADGFVTQHWQSIDWRAGAWLLIDMKPGQGTSTHNLKHPLADIPQGEIPPDWLAAKLGQSPNLSPEPHGQNKIIDDNKQRPLAPNERPGGAVFMDPPDSIIVGFASDGGYCCGNNCATSQVFSLETYVQKGLDNEWISSWAADSLKAGSVAFRSYGAWHAIASPYAGYDICAGPCCQAFEQTSYASTVAAAEATRGIMLEINGVLARSEYSAENNAWNDPNDGLSCTNTDLSCGDGFVGSPANSWPCLADNSAGRGCFGHGRGMSQWGSYYHASAGKNWGAIVDHYYNASGNPSGERSQYATSPVNLLSFAAWPATLNAGDTFSISLTIDNAAGLANGVADFGPLLIGASLLDGNSDYSDPANDTLVNLTVFGPQNISRPFQTADTWPAGVYDLAVALWLDIDGNGMTTGDDWVLAFDVQTSAINLLVANDLVFASGFD